MDPTLRLLLGVLMRWLHITSVVVLIGSAYYVKRSRSAFSPAFRSTIYVSIAALTISGLYNFLTKTSYPPHYHMFFGIKVLLALHVLAALALSAGRAASEKLDSSLRVLLISAAVVILLSNYLRWISINPGVQLP